MPTQTIFSCGDTASPLPNGFARYPPPDRHHGLCRPCHKNKIHNSIIAIKKHYNDRLNDLNDVIDDLKRNLGIAEFHLMGFHPERYGVSKGVVRKADGVTYVDWPGKSKESKWQEELNSAEREKDEIEKTMKEEIKESKREYDELWAPWGRSDPYYGRYI